MKDFFHRVRVNTKDADSLRFLWKEDIHSNSPPDTYQMLVHVFGAKDSPGCANYALKRVARDNAEQFDGLTTWSVLHVYVDDLLKSVQTEEQAIKVALELIDMLRKGSLKLTKFVSSSKAVLDALPAADVSPPGTVSINGEEASIQRALGEIWDTLADIITFLPNLRIVHLPKGESLPQ